MYSASTGLCIFHLILWRQKGVSSSMEERVDWHCQKLRNSQRRSRDPTIIGRDFHPRSHLLATLDTEKGEGAEEDTHLSALVQSCLS